MKDRRLSREEALAGRSPAASMARGIAHANSQPSVTRCAECRWYFVGKVGEGKQAFRSHRELRHP